MHPHSNLLDLRTERICETCGISFLVRKAELRRRSARFCSKACMGRGTRRSPEERFWEKVDRSGGPDSCWLWLAHTNPKGYGRFAVGGRDGGQEGAHRASWRLHHGEIPPGMRVLHNCPAGDNPTCVNPAHLWLGTDKDNMDDMVAKGRARRHFGRHREHIS